MALIYVRRDTTANWIKAGNPVLQPGEGGLNTDTGEVFFGDGFTRYTDLPKTQIAPAGKSFALVDDSTQLLEPEALAAVLAAANRQVIPGHTQGARYVAYGHSFGQVQSPPNVLPRSIYPERVRALTGADPDTFQNLTVSGSNMGNIAARAVATWTQGTYGLITLMGNQNSVGADHASSTGEATYKAALRQFLNHVRGGTTAPPTVVVVRDTTSTTAGYARYGTNPPTDADVARFNGYLQQVVAEYPSNGSILVARPDDGWDPATMTCPDGQHPNDRGMAHIAAAIMAAVRAGGYREGLNLGIAASAPPTPLTPVATDTFNRADNSSTLGAAQTGQTWVTPSGTVFGIVTNQAKTGTSFGENGYAWLETGKADVDVALVLGRSTSSEGTGPVMRLTDLNNCLAVDCQVGVAGGVTLYRRVGGTYTALGSAGTPAVGDTVTVRGRGPNVTVLLNGSLILSVTESFNQTATKHGMRVTSAANAVDSIQVSA